MNVSLTDNLRTSITPNEFRNVVINYKHSSSFYINVQCNIVQNQNAASLTKEVVRGLIVSLFFIYRQLIVCYFVQCFEQFLYDDNKGDLLGEQKENGGLVEKSRKRLINVAVKFAVSIFGDKPNKDQKEKVANVVAAIFPTLSTVRNLLKKIR